jgi:hypothetical protein
MEKESLVKVEGPASPELRKTVQQLGPGMAKGIQKVVVEPSGQPGQMGFVTNKPEEQGVIHIPEKNIDKALSKAQPGVDPQKMKEQKGVLLQDVVLPHEHAHLEDVTKGEGQFSPQTEQLAEKAEDRSRLEDQYGLRFKSASMVRVVTGFIKDAYKHDNDPAVKLLIQAIGAEPERQVGYLNQARGPLAVKSSAYPNDKNLKGALSRIEEAISLQGAQESRRLIQEALGLIKAAEPMMQGRRPVPGKTPEIGDVPMDPNTMPVTYKIADKLDKIADTLESKGLVKLAAQIDLISNTIENL